MTLPVLFALSACLATPPDSDRILARDVVRAFPALAGVDGDSEIGLAPAPGATRQFQAADLRMLARRFHLEDGAIPEPFCVTRPVAPLDAAAIVQAMKDVLPDARIEVLDFSRQTVPQGRLEFPLSGLRPPAVISVDNKTASTIWYGVVRYGGNRRFTTWAKVRVRVPSTRVYAAIDLLPGRPIEAVQLSVQTREEFPGGAEFFTATDGITGRWPRVAIRAGAPVRGDQLEKVREVMTGQTVRVEVRNGAARLEFEAVAQGSGSVGQFIPILNPASKKRFRGRIEGKGRVSVDLVAGAAAPSGSTAKGADQ